MKESDLMRSVKDYLTYGMNQGKWLSLRLNSGDFFLPSGEGKFRRVQGCPSGTADFMVTRKWWPQGAPNKWETLVIFLELKSSKGKTSLAQNAFKIIVEAQGASYFVIHGIEDLMEVLGDKDNIG